jgi:hypothetical protein
VEEGGGVSSNMLGAGQSGTKAKHLDAERAKAAAAQDWSPITPNRAD